MKNPSPDRPRGVRRAPAAGQSFVFDRLIPLLMILLGVLLIVILVFSVLVFLRVIPFG